MGWMARVQFPAGEKDFYLLQSVQTRCSGAHPATYPMGTGISFLVVKQPVHEADHSPPSNVEVKNGEAIPSLPHIFMA
jgi:hypothetical protein